MAFPARTGIAASLTALALVTGCASTIEVGSHFDETVNLSNYSTFTWIADPPYIGGEPSMRPSEDVQATIGRAIRAELEALGYSFVTERDEADFVVAYMTGSRERIREEDYPEDLTVFESWSVPGSLHAVHDPGVHIYTEGTLSVDLFDTHSGKPLWHGWTQKTILEADRRDPTPSIERGLRQLFATFPGTKR